MPAAFAGIGAGTQHREGQPRQPHAQDLCQVIIEKIGVIIHRRIRHGDKRAHKDNQLAPQARQFRHLQLEELHRR